MRTIPVESARAAAVHAQWLDRTSDDLETVAVQLGHLPLNVTDIVLPSAEHIAYTRCGTHIGIDDVRAAAERHRTLFEHFDQPAPGEPWAIMLRPTSDLPLLRAVMTAWDEDHPQSAEWVDVNHAFRDDVLRLLADDGPVPQSAIPDTAAIPYQSSGWNTGRNVAMLLEHFQRAGVVAVAERRGSERLWDLADRILPPGPTVDRESARVELAQRRLRAGGVLRPKAAEEFGEPVRVEGVQGIWRLADDADFSPVAPVVRVLSPLDRLIFDRIRMRRLWDFEYAIEQYTPAARRRWGAFALPVLHGADLVGKVDARVDRDRGVLHVAALHWDVQASTALRSATIAELERFASWMGLPLVVDA